MEGAITIDGGVYQIKATQVELRWFISRASLEKIINALLPVMVKMASQIMANWFMEVCDRIGSRQSKNAKMLMATGGSF